MHKHYSRHASNVSTCKNNNPFLGSAQNILCTGGGHVQYVEYLVINKKKNLLLYAWAWIPLNPRASPCLKTWDYTDSAWYGLVRARARPMVAALLLASTTCGPAQVIPHMLARQTIYFISKEVATCYILANFRAWQKVFIQLRYRLRLVYKRKFFLSFLQFLHKINFLCQKLWIMALLLSIGCIKKWKI